LDTNVYDVFEPFDLDEMGHNICSFGFNEDHDCSCEGGPSSIDDCLDWFRQLWEEQLEWLQLHLSQSTADWQIVVTHFPPSFDRAVFGNLTVDYGIDLFVTGHLHRQEVHGADDEDNFLAPTVWVVSGGGGGITSDWLPDLGGDSQSYGFMHMTLARDQIEVVNVRHTGVEGDRAVVYQRPCVLCSEDDVAHNLQVYQEGLQRRGFAGDIPTTLTATSSTTITGTTISVTSSTGTTMSTTSSTITTGTTITTGATTGTAITTGTSRTTGLYYLFTDNQITTPGTSTTTATVFTSPTFTETAKANQALHWLTSPLGGDAQQQRGCAVRPAALPDPPAGQRELARASSFVENVSRSLSGAASVAAATALTAVVILWLRGGIRLHFNRAEAVEGQTPPAEDPSRYDRLKNMI
jgi:hypothetical protein